MTKQEKIKDLMAKLEVAKAGRNLSEIPLTDNYYKVREQLDKAQDE